MIVTGSTNWASTYWTAACTPATNPDGAEFTLESQTMLMTNGDVDADPVAAADAEPIGEVDADPCWPAPLSDAAAVSLVACSGTNRDADAVSAGAVFQD